MGYKKVQIFKGWCELICYFFIILVIVINLFLLDRTVQNKMQPYSCHYFYFCPNSTFNALQTYSESALIPSLPPSSSLPTLNPQQQHYSSMNLFNNQIIPPHPLEKMPLTPSTFYTYPSPPPVLSTLTNIPDITPK